MKAVKLIGFAIVCLLIAPGILLCLYSPSINPGFINGHLFPDWSVGGKELALAASPSSETKALRQVFDGMDKPLSDADFQRLGISKPEDIYFKGPGSEKLHGWLFLTPGAEDTVLLSGSWHADVRFPALLGYIKTLQQINCSVFVYDYRGLGSSKGKLGPKTAVEDGISAYNYLINERKINPETLILMGRVTGAYVSCQISKHYPCKALILEEPWTTLKDYIDTKKALTRIMPLSMYPGDGLDNLPVLMKKHPPVLIASTSPTQIAPREIYERIEEPKQFVQLNEYQMVDLPNLTIDSERYGREIVDLIEGNSKPDLKADVGGSVPAIIEWQSDLTVALANAKKQNKWVLIDVYADWCGWCKKMDNDTYAHASVRNYINRNYVAVKVKKEDPVHGKQITRKYDIIGIPCTIILDQDGKLVGKISGYLTAKRFLSCVEGYKT